MGTKIYNSDLIKELREGAKIMTSVDPTPGEIADKVVPVMEVNPKLLREINYANGGRQNTTGNFTLATLPIDKDFYLTNANLFIQKDISCDNNVVYLEITLDNGSIVYLFDVANVLGVISSESFNQTFINPIKLKRGSVIRVGGAFTAGVMARSATIFGYFVNNIYA